MMRAEDLVATIASLQWTDLEVWIRDDLVAPTRQAEALIFSEMECARVRLICTLRYELDVDGDTLPLVLSLIDQLYESRQRLYALGAAVSAQDERVRLAILATMAPRPGGEPDEIEGSV